MSCPNSTAPINIDSSPIGNCELKCKYSYKYKDSPSKLTNNTSFLSLTHEGSYPEPVTYNANKYNVDEIRIYTPSLHTYSGKRSVGEVIIRHTSPTEKLIICIPLELDSKVNQTLDTIITNAKKYTQKPGGSTMINSINLNSFIPNKKFYTYKGTLPYNPCNGEYNYIVFSKNDNAYIPITNYQLDDLNKIITQNTIKTAKNSSFYVNTKGPILTSQNNGDDNIYIDCKPVSDDGEVIGEKKLGSSTINTSFKGIDFDKIVDSIIFKVIIGFLLLFILVTSMRFFFRYIKPKTLIKPVGKLLTK
jgi:carbonic anhydrase